MPLLRDVLTAPRVLAVLVLVSGSLASLPALASRTGISSRSGKQSGASCIQCHGNATGSLQVTLAVENQDGTAAVQPLSPANTYVLRARARRADMNMPFMAGFNLATGRAAFPREQGQLLVRAGDTTTRILAGEATHTNRTSSTVSGMDHVVEWRVDWKPPLFAAGVSGQSRVYLASRAPGVGVRVLSAVSGGMLNSAMECTPQNAAACGIPVTISPGTCTDADGDGFMSMACEVTDPARNGGDCNDADPAVFPGAPELCNGRDDNCAAGADEGLPLMDFYPDADGDMFGARGATAVAACSAERAEALGVPNAVTNGVDCNDMSAGINPGAAEVCDGLDQNCNDRADETFTFNGVRIGQFCDGEDPDTCANGIVRCMGLSMAACVDDLPRAEVCDAAGNDDNCDGMPDSVAFPSLGQACTSAQGCGSVEECSADGTGTRCADVVAEARDICGNNKDDDCDGTTDETDDLQWNGIPFGQPCDSAADADRCTTGRVDCSNGRAACVDDVATPELCADMLDNDCDGEMDESDCEAATSSSGGMMMGSSSEEGSTSSSGGSSTSSSGGGGDGEGCACADAQWPSGGAWWVFGLALPAGRRRVRR